MKIRLVWLFLLIHFYVLPDVLDNTSRDKPVVIMTTLAGRKENLKILFQYVDALLSRGLIDEYHIWNYALDLTDRQWIKNQEYLATLKNPDKFIVKQIGEKIHRLNFKKYYAYYAMQHWIPDDVFIRTDDDILYIDIDAFPRFVQKVRNNKSGFLTFANIINNGVCAHHQYKLQMQPLDLPCDACSELWDSGELGQQQHEYFVSHISEILQIAASQPEDAVIVHPINQRFSINFFGLRGSNFLVDAFKRLARRTDEESSLTEWMPGLYNRTHYIDPSMIVSHGAFGPQRNSKKSASMNEQYVQELYTRLANSLFSKEKNEGPP